MLFARAQDIRDIVAIEAQLSRRQAELDSLKGQLAYLEDQTTLSTITVYLEQAPDEPEPAEKPEKADDNAFVAGLKGGWGACPRSPPGWRPLAGALLPVRGGRAAARRPGRDAAPPLARPAPAAPPGRRRPDADAPRVGAVETDSSAVRIAVLIDADNTSPKYAEAILDELARYGTPTIKRAYGDFSSTRLQRLDAASSTRARSGRCTRTPSPPARTPPTPR